MTCRHPAKLRFETITEAEAQLRHAKRHSKQNKKQLNTLHVYQCPDAPAHWHLGHDRLKRTRLDAPASIQTVGE